MADLDPSLEAGIDYSTMLPAKNAVLQKQLAMAQALRNKAVAQPPAYGLGGGLAAGLAGGINHLVGTHRENQLLQQIPQLAQQQGADLRGMMLHPGGDSLAPGGVQDLSQHAIYPGGGASNQGPEQVSSQTFYAPDEQQVQNALAPMEKGIQQVVNDPSSQVIPFGF